MHHPHIRKLRKGIDFLKIYSANNAADLRVTWNHDESRVLQAMNKNRYKNHDMGSNLVYDFRVGLAVSTFLPFDDDTNVDSERASGAILFSGCGARVQD